MSDVTEDTLRDALKVGGFTRDNALGEVWVKGGNVYVTVGANEIVLVQLSPRVERRFNRSHGGLALAIEYIQYISLR